MRLINFLTLCLHSSLSKSFCLNCARLSLYILISFPSLLVSIIWRSDIVLIIFSERVLSCFMMLLQLSSDDLMFAMFAKLFLMTPVRDLALAITCPDLLIWFTTLIMTSFMTPAYPLLLVKTIPPPKFDV